MLKFIILVFGGIYMYYKVIKPYLYSKKIPNMQAFEQVKAEKDAIERKVLSGKVTKQEVAKLQDLTESLRYVCYGVTSKLDIEGVCLTISTLFAEGANQTNLYNNLMEICATESLLGTAIYNPARGYGYGLFQFDKVAFDDIKQLIQTKHSNQFLFICNKDINAVAYDDLKTHALIACFFCRVYLKYRIPSMIGDSLKARAEQWKKYYNTELGKGTVAGYIEKSKQMGVA